MHLNTTSGVAAYRAAVESLESLLRLSSEAAGETALRERFQRMGYLLHRLGDPHERFPSVHVAGTSGKGSTTAMIGAILRAAGLKTGVHCTPYLQTPIERAQVDDLYMSPADFVRLTAFLQPHITHMKQQSPLRDISYRELVVAQAFMHFAATEVEIAAIETGMGGLYDYTNHIRPLVSVIVTVDYDHVATLGPTLQRIAYHKSGIIKDGTPVVTGVTQKDALAVIEAQSSVHSAPLYRLGHEIKYAIGLIGVDGGVFDYRSPWGKLLELRVGMLGRHQVLNAALATSAALLLRQRGWRVSDDAIRSGLAAARLPGRLEIVQQQPTVVLDGAHNPEKMRALAAALRELFPGRKPVIVLGILAAKQADDILPEILPLAQHVVVTTPHVRAKPAVSPEALAEAVRSLGRDVVVEPDVFSAVGRAKQLSGDDGLVCVTGSLYMVGQARELWAPTEAILEQRTSFPVL